MRRATVGQEVSVHTFRNNPRYGNGSHTIRDCDEEDATVDLVELASTLDATFSAVGYQPPLLPSIALELMNIARKPDVTFPVVASLLEKEPLLASQVLRIAQSTIYRRASPIRSLEQAASLLGLRALADLFLQASLTTRVFRAPTYQEPMNQLRDHALRRRFSLASSVVRLRSRTNMPSCADSFMTSASRRASSFSPSPVADLERKWRSRSRTFGPSSKRPTRPHPEGWASCGNSRPTYAWSSDTIIL
jgi:hypothetical protein